MYFIRRGSAELTPMCSVLLIACLLARTIPAAARGETRLVAQRHGGGEAHLLARRRRTRRVAPITRALLIGNGAAFLVTMQRRNLFELLAKNDALLRRGQYHRLISAVFLHGSIPHILINSVSLNNLGPAVETHFGADRFIGTYLLSGVAGNLLSLQVGRSPLSVGASGAIFGLLGAWAVYLQRNEAFFNAGAVQTSLSGIAQTCALNAAMGMSPGSRIDNMGHLGGLLGGATCSFLFGPRLRANRFLGTVVDEPLLRLPQGPFTQRKAPGRRRRRR